MQSRRENCRVNSITIILPVPPTDLSKNGRVNRWKRHRLFQQHKESARLVIYGALRGERPEWSNGINVRVDWYIASGRPPDIDNATERIAAYMDGAQAAGLIADDRHIAGYQFRFGVDHESPHVTLTFERILSEGQAA